MVKAKFKCDTILLRGGGKDVHMHPVISGGTEENKSFAKYTPSGTLTISIDNETPAVNFFEVGKEYYLDFTEAN